MRLILKRAWFVVRALAHVAVMLGGLLLITVAGPWAILLGAFAMFLVEAVYEVGLWIFVANDDFGPVRRPTTNRHCSRCSSRVDLHAAFCGCCGEPAPAPPACSKCGLPFETHEKYCTACGAMRPDGAVVGELLRPGPLSYRPPKPRLQLGSSTHDFGVPRKRQ